MSLTTSKDRSTILLILVENKKRTLRLLLRILLTVVSVHLIVHSPLMSVPIVDLPTQIKVQKACTL